MACIIKYIIIILNKLSLKNKIYKYSHFALIFSFFNVLPLHRKIQASDLYYCLYH